jgi:hypothetical protein
MPPKELNLYSGSGFPFWSKRSVQSKTSGKGNLMKKYLLYIISILILTSVLAGCTGNSLPPAAGDPARTATLPSSPAPKATAAIRSPTGPSSTPDPCSTGQIEASVQKVHRHMREFDDASVLASKLPRDQVPVSVADLQKIRREAEDEEIPACLTNLKKYQVDHMNTVINTLLSFIGGSDTKTLEQGIAVARQQHDQYTLELARLLGLTVVPATPAVTGTAPTGTATP